MAALSDFLSSNMVLVFFVYGLGWFVVGLAILLTTQKTLNLVLTRNLYWLAAFGFVHASVEWADMALLLPPPISTFSMNPAVPIVKVGFLILSSLFMLRFGVGMVYGFWRSRILIALPILLFVLWLASPLYSSYLVASSDVSFASIAAGPDATCLRCHASMPDIGTSHAPATPSLKTTLEVFTRYLLYFPGLVTSGIGFYLMARLFRKSGLPALARDSYLTAVVMVTNSFFAGLIVAPAPFVLADWLNYHSFFSTTGLPPQVFRAFMAVATAFFIVRVLRVYRMEQERQLEASNRQLTTLNQEMHHRIRNNLQTMADLLSLELNHYEAQTGGESIRDSVGRVKSIAAVHELLHPNNVEATNIKEIAERVVAISAHGLQGRGKMITTSVVGPDVLLTSKQATAVALVLNEVVSNAFEHAFPGQVDSGEILVMLKRSGLGLSISVTNDGLSLPRDFQLPRSQGLGLQIARNLVENDLKGVLTLETKGSNTVATMYFVPVQPPSN